MFSSEPNGRFKNKFFSLANAQFKRNKTTHLRFHSLYIVHQKHRLLFYSKETEHICQANMHILKALQEKSKYKYFS